MHVPLVCCLLTPFSIVTASQSNPSRTPANDTVASVGFPSSSSRNSSVAESETVEREPQLSRQYVPSTASTAREQAEEDEISDDDDAHSIGGSSVEEEANTSTGSALGTTSHVHYESVDEQQPVAASIHSNHTHEQPQLAEAVALPTYHGGNSGYPIDKKSSVLGEPASPVRDNEGSAASHDEPTHTSIDREEAAPISTSNAQVS